MGLPFDEIVNIYYSYLEKNKAEEYAKEAFNRNIENLLKNGGTLYPNMVETIKKYRKIVHYILLVIV